MHQPALGCLYYRLQGPENLSCGKEWRVGGDGFGKGAVFCKDGLK